MVETIGVLMQVLLLRLYRLRTRHRITKSVLRNNGFFLLLLLLLLLRLLWRLLQRFSGRYRINRTKSSYERCLVLMFVRPVMIVPRMIMMVMMTRVIVPMMMVMMVAVRQ